MIQELNEFVVEKLLWWLLAHISHPHYTTYVELLNCINGSTAKTKKKRTEKYYHWGRVL